MAAPILDQRDLDFLLYEVFDVESLATRERIVSIIVRLLMRQ